MVGLVFERIKEVGFKEKFFQQSCEVKFFLWNNEKKCIWENKFKLMGEKINSCV